MLAIICKQRPLNNRDCSYTVPLWFCVAGTVKVKSSGIQVGDLIIVKKVCHKFHPHLYIVWAFMDLQVAIYVTVNNEGVVQCAPTSGGGERS